MAAPLVEEGQAAEGRGDVGMAGWQYPFEDLNAAFCERLGLCKSALCYIEHRQKLEDRGDFRIANRGVFSIISSARFKSGSASANRPCVA